jgi:hypothetical protein
MKISVISVIIWKEILFIPFTLLHELLGHFVCHELVCTVGLLLDLTKSTPP